MTKHTIVAALVLGASLSLGSCCSLCSTSASDAEGPDGPKITPTPGNNCNIVIQPQPGSGQPSMWMSYNFQNENPGGTTNTLKIGSEAVDLSVGGARATHGKNYALKVTGLTGTSPTAELIELDVTPTPAGVPVTVTPVSASSNALQTFSAYIRQDPTPADRLLMNVMDSDKGVQVIVSAWPTP